jgi:hypothetical protein
MEEERRWGKGNIDRWGKHAGLTSLFLSSFPQIKNEKIFLAQPEAATLTF